MSGSKQATSFGRDNRRSPVGNRRSKISKAEKTMPLSNGLQEVTPDLNTQSVGHRSGSFGQDKVLKMNLLTVQKLDASVVRLESTVPQVVLYRYEMSSNTWERTSVEGTLFVFERKVSPSFGFVVLNKLHSGNSMEYIQPGMEFRVQEPFVLFKKEESASKIYGLCFQEVGVCKEAGALLNRLSGVANHSTDKQWSVETSSTSQEPAKRSASMMTLSKTESDQQPATVDVLDMLEIASSSYLGQTFSDGASSPDSLISEPIAFLTPTPTTTTTSQHHANTITHTRDVPGVRITPKARAYSASPRKQPQAGQVPFQSSRIQHATSFHYNQSGSVDTSNVTESHNFPRTTRSFDHGSRIVRKLFSPAAGNAPNPSGPHTDTASQTIDTPTSGVSMCTIPIKAISLDELEKQMTAEVDGSDSSNPISVSSRISYNNFALSSTSFLEQVPSYQQSSLNTRSIAVSTQPSPVSVSVKPPSHFTLHNSPQIISNVASAPLLAHTVTTNHSLFPSIPPLMHSAGMKAAPIVTGGSEILDLPVSVFHSSSFGRVPSEPVSHVHSQTLVKTPAGMLHALSPLPELLIQNGSSHPTPVSSTLMSPQQFKQEQKEQRKDTSHTTKTILSKDQLLQAFDYLLKHDEHFTDQLYYAYQQSLLTKQ